MTFIPGYRARVLMGDFALASYLTDVSMPTDVEMFDKTTMGDFDPTTGRCAKTFVPGRQMSTVSLKGYLDPDATAGLLVDQINTWTGAEAFSYAPQGFAIGNEVNMVSALKTSRSSAASVGALITFDLAAQATGLIDKGVSLHDLSAETADGSATSFDGGAQSTNGGVAHLHVTAFSGLTGAVVTIEDSANNSTFATVSGLTFTTVAGTTQERLEITGTIRRYVRATVDVTGTGSVTYAVAIARR